MVKVEGIAPVSVVFNEVEIERMWRMCSLAQDKRDAPVDHVFGPTHPSSVFKITQRNYKFLSHEQRTGEIDLKHEIKFSLALPIIKCMVVS